ncbi:MAG: GyrI-like domain-containing protein, partial [Chloroflexi bacterium]|nr:GyrI-like domain-containing protein [Chloroflexota bacterium]
QELLRTDRRILDVALDYQFNNPETFSRAFRRVFGMPPSQWQKQGRADRRLIMPRLTRAHLAHITRGACRPPVLQERAAFHVAGIMTLVRDDPAVVAHAWNLLAHELANAPHAGAPTVYYGITYYPDDWESRGVLYLAAGEIPAPHTASPALVVKTIPALKYARFIHQGPPSDLPLTLDYIYHTWLPKSEQRLARPLVIECWRHHASGGVFGHAVFGHAAFGHTAFGHAASECGTSEHGVYIPIE